MAEEAKKLIAPYIVTKMIDGVEYMRIPDECMTYLYENNQTYESNTVWFRTNVENLILANKIPDDLRRCPRCLSTNFEDAAAADDGSTCNSCHAKFDDLGWVWMEVLFPDPEIVYLLEHTLTNGR